MKTNRNSILLRSLALAGGGLVMLAATLPAAPFVYTRGDLVLTFRRSGGANDLAVNIGPATNFNNLATNFTIPITTLSVTQLSAAFPNFNSLRWAVAAANRLPAIPGYPVQTLWVTAPRATNALAVPAGAWARRTQTQQGNAGSPIHDVGLRAVAYSSSQAANPTNNTVTGVTIPTSAPLDQTLAPLFGANGDYDGSFIGIVENVTPANFIANPANVSRSDLYELIPDPIINNDPPLLGRRLGYFELKPDGSLTFNTGSPLPPPPTITNTQRSGDVTTVSFTTASGGTYRLRSTDASGLTSPRSTWTTGASLTGNGSVLSLADTNAAATRFYSVEAY